MAQFTCNCPSYTLGRELRFNVFLPEYVTGGDFKTVYLLHGLSDDCTSWFRRSSAERYARNHNAAIICPEAECSFYTNTAAGDNFYDYVAKEVVEISRRMFRLSDKREDTFIAGLSMGGYGAYMIALKNPDVFSAAASLSGAVDICDIMCDRDDFSFFSRKIWGDDYKKTLPGSDGDIFALVDKLEKSDMPKPRLFQLCGRSDFMLNGNRKFNEFMKDKSFEHCYYEVDGGHEWAVWDEALPKVLDFFLGQ